MYAILIHVQVLIGDMYQVAYYRNYIVPQGKVTFLHYALWVACKVAHVAKQ